MPGNIVLRPLEANLTRNMPNIEKIHPYYVVALGRTKIRSQPAKKGGKTPEWEESVSVPSAEATSCRLKLKAKRTLLPDKTIGVCNIDLNELNEDKISRWYDVVHKNKPIGRILIEGSIFSGAKSANELDQRREPLIEAADNNRQVASLNNLVDVDTREVREMIKNGDNAVETERNYEVGKALGVPAVNIMEENGQHRDLENLEGLEVVGDQPRFREFVGPTIVIQRDSILEEIPVERTDEEEIAGVVKFRHNM